MKRGPKNVARAKQMRAQGWSYARIAGHFKVGETTVRCWLDPELTEARKAPNKNGHRVDRIKVQAKDGAAAPQIPEDTRDLTGRLCGDPLPGRRAIDRRGAQ